MCIWIKKKRKENKSADVGRQESLTTAPEVKPQERKGYEVPSRATNTPLDKSQVRVVLNRVDI